MDRFWSWNYFGFRSSICRPAALALYPGVSPMETFLQDLRYAIRTVRRDIGFFLAAVCITGLGIGASSTIFSVVNALLIRPLPFRDPGSLVWIANHLANDAHDLSGQTIQVNHFLDLRQHNHSLSDLAAYFAFYGVGDSKLTGRGEPERLTGVPVSQNLFPLLGVQPQLEIGRAHVWTPVTPISRMPSSA